MDARRFRNLYSISLAVLDTVLLVVSLYSSFQLRTQINWPSEANDMPTRFLPYATAVLPLFVGSNLFVFFLFRLYHVPRATSRVDEFYAIFGGISVGTLLFVALAALFLRNSILDLNVPRLMVGYAWALSIMLITLGRWALGAWRDVLRSRGVAADRVLIVGTGEAARLVAEKIRASAYLGYKLMGFVGEEAGMRRLEGVPVVGRIDALPALLDRFQPDEVIIALPQMSDAEILRVINACQRDRLSLKVFPDVYDIVAAGVTIDDLGGLPLMSIRDSATRGWKTAAKRAMDILGASIALILASPLMLIVAILIKVGSKGPVFFSQDRMGIDGKLFPMLKFRSMRLDSEAAGPGWTTENDPRVTPIGRLIRKHSIDETPQFINILMGDMSLVGPRPEQPAFVEQFRKLIPRYMERHTEKAGLTGWAQVNGLRGDTSIEERTKYDLWYIENWSLWLDIKIIIRTIVKVFFDRSAY